MKRFACLILCLLLILVSAAAAADTEITIQEKMSRQIQEGSGLKGSFTLSATGEDTEIVRTLQNILNVPFQFRSLRNRKDLHAYIYQKEGDEGQIGLTELYLKGGESFLRSDLTGETVYSLPELSGVIDALRTPEGGNPSFTSLIYNFATLPDADFNTVWTPVLAKYKDRLEVWLSDFAAETSVRKLDDGTSVIDMNYLIPTNAVSKETVALLSEAVKDQDFMALLKNVATEEQYAMLSNPHLGYFFEEALNSQMSDGDIVLTRSVTTRGAEISGGIELPLNEAYLGYGRLDIEKNGNTVQCTLSGADKAVTAEFEPEKIIDLTTNPLIRVCVTPGNESENSDGKESKPMAFRIAMSKSVNDLPIDDNTPFHSENIRVTVMEDLTFIPEDAKREDYAGNVPELTLDAELQYKTNIAKNKPVNLDVQVKLITPENEFSFNGNFKTNAPWVFNPFATESAVNLMTLSPEERIAAGLNWLAGAGSVFTVEPAEAGSQDAAETAAPEAAETAAQETTEAPAAKEEPEAAAEESAPAEHILK